MSIFYDEQQNRIDLTAFPLALAEGLYSGFFRPNVVIVLDRFAFFAKEKHGKQ
jgi:hypothetical protein